VTDPDEEPDFLESVSSLESRRFYNAGYDTRLSDHDAAKAVMRQCRAIYGSTDACDEGAIWSPGTDVQAVAEHDLQAIRPVTGAGAMEQPAVLQYLSAEEKTLTRTWYDLASYGPNACTGRATSVDACDEYPYYSTEEGGPGGSLKPLSRVANSLEGSLRGAFYSGCGMPSEPRKSPGRTFIVVSVPGLAPTRAWCSSSTAVAPDGPTGATS
jgi:hypothetical protein